MGFMKKLSSKIILLFVAFTILPAIPMALVVNNLVKRSVGVGANAQVGRALQGSLDLYRENYTVYRRGLLDALPEWPARDLAAFMQKHQLHQVDILSQHKQSQARGDASIPACAPPPAEVFLRTDPEAGLLAVDRVEGRMMQMGRALVDPRGDTTYVVLTRLLPEKLTTAAAQVRDVLQWYRTLDFVLDDVHRAFILSFLVIYLPVLGLAIAAAFYFSRKITAPLTGLAAATEQVAAGNWDCKLPESGSDEIGQVIDSFNNMVGQLQENQEKLVSLEKMAAWREIARVLAHEIKNPLTPIQLTIQQLRDKYDGSDAQYAALLHNCTDIINDEVEGLRNLVREFSDFARMPAMKKEMMQINEVIGDVVRLFQAAPVSFYPVSVPDFPMDGEKMHRVFINLLENAVAAAGEKGKVEIHVALNRGQVQVQVSDDGPGIAADVLPRIFEPYFTTKHRGMGLGLAVVKKVVEEHGGKIMAANRPQSGACFTITLPLQSE